MDYSAASIAQIYSQFGTADFENNWVAQDWTLKDKVGYAAARNSYDFFAQPSGSQDPGLGVIKTEEQTNLANPGQIPGQNFFIVQNIRMFIQNSAKVRQLGTGVATDTSFAARQRLFSSLVSAISLQGMLEWTINNKQFMVQNLPFLTFAAGFGLGEVFPPAVGYTDGDPAAITGGANAYVANSPYDIDGGNITDSWKQQPITILAPSTSFTMKLKYTNGVNPSPANIYGASADQTATLWLCCYLDGQLVRPRS